MSRKYSIAEARARLPAIIDQAEAGQEIEVTRRGKPVAAVVSVRELARLRGSAGGFTTLAALVFGPGPLPGPMNSLSPWIDARFMGPVEPLLEGLEAQRHRRAARPPAVRRARSRASMRAALANLRTTRSRFSFDR